MTQRHQILVGDCIEMMRTLPDKSVHTCVTSPPYFGLRDYGVEGQIGLEQTPGEFLARLVEVFREVRRVLRDDGTVWVNMGDSYAGSWGAQGRPQGDGQMSGRSVTSARQINEHPRFKSGTGVRGREMGLKSKDLMGIPWRLAFALQDDGWYLRQDIIWNKPNPMPESVRDRCTKSHEYIFLLSKSKKYYFDQAAIAEDAIEPRGPGNISAAEALPGERESENSNIRGSLHKIGPRLTRNKRSTWSVATHSFKGAHFATFPPDLIRPCILAGAPRGGLVLDPFGGAGTTALVAMQEGRRSILCELNPEYAALSRRRLYTAWLDGAAQMDVFHDSALADRCLLPVP
ncbi:MULTISPECIES: site-specific DNA-methyltransferase [unclassified Pseudomonas]|uniref:DNA-methyltransferase n=1 Tax=unclassified Pseudomonas TaxID=196821 RepID=UPI000D35BF5C|nr:MULTISPECIES: site-specific DNA-methyltransferase [unclassified Pseudomonas]RAU43472.1 site-specific DNA-methyltransferase [Pseudomonas sp. RIT 409]RAU49991.1 site-specific DNA-methyltransferase [Pseudomonas sp. RIT 412]